MNGNSAWCGEDRFYFEQLSVLLMQTVMIVIRPNAVEGVCCANPER